MADSSGSRVAFATLGCKVNQSEIDLLARQFSAAGYRQVPFDTPADVYVLNTCTVTHVADKKSRQLIGQARRANPEALVVATGCYASIAHRSLDADSMIVVRNRDKDRLVQLVQGRLQHDPAEPPFFADEEKYQAGPPGQTRARPTVKAQDGCDSHCTYCIIPRSRGRSRSVDPEEVVRRVNDLVAEGHAEVVITGVDLGSYGEDAEGLPDLGGLLRRLLDKTLARRIRVSSLEPGDFKLDWLHLWQDPRMCRQLHVPLQAGSGGVLSRMERKYSPAQFAEMVDACRKAIPELTITTDVMVGFPGETEAEFDEGFRFIRNIRFDGLHVFKYSVRSGTRAAHMPDQVPEQIKDQRSQILRDENKNGVSRLIERHRGKVKTVVWEHAEEEGVRRGLTDTNVRVYEPCDGAEPAAISEVRLAHPFRDGMWSEPIHDQAPPLIGLSLKTASPAQLDNATQYL